MHPDLKFAGVLPPLDAPHHLRSTEWGPYREGVVRSSDPASGSLIDVGLEKVGGRTDGQQAPKRVI
jgi:predicted SPOUT superfamily RNA methylase MTH1